MSIETIYAFALTDHDGHIYVSSIRRTMIACEQYAEIYFPSLKGNFSIIPIKISAHPCASSVSADADTLP